MSLELKLNLYTLSLRSVACIPTWVRQSDLRLARLRGGVDLPHLDRDLMRFDGLHLPRPLEHEAEEANSVLSQNINSMLEGFQLAKREFGSVILYYETGSLLSPFSLPQIWDKVIKRDHENVARNCVIKNSNILDVRKLATGGYEVDVQYPERTIEVSEREGKKLEKYMKTGSGY